jgi:hypothetical protein
VRPAFSHVSIGSQKTIPIFSHECGDPEHFSVRFGDVNNGLRRSFKLELYPRSPDSIQLSVELSDPFGTSLIILKLGRVKRGFLFQRLDLQVNQLKKLSFAAGGWVRHHGYLQVEIVADCSRGITA